MDDGGLVTTATSNPAAGSAQLLADYAPTHDRGLPSSKGQTVTVLRSEPEWAQVRNADGKTGWVPLSFLEIAEGTAASSAARVLVPGRDGGGFKRRPPVFNGVWKDDAPHPGRTQLTFWYFCSMVCAGLTVGSQGPAAIK